MTQETGVTQQRAMYAYKRFESPKQGKSFAVAFQRVEGGILAAYSFLSRKDRWDKKRGREIAEGRLVKHGIFVSTEAIGSTLIKDAVTYLLSNVEQLSGVRP